MYLPIPKNICFYIRTSRYDPQGLTIGIQGKPLVGCLAMTHTVDLSLVGEVHSQDLKIGLRTLTHSSPSLRLVPSKDHDRGVVGKA